MGISRRFVVIPLVLIFTSLCASGKPAKNCGKQAVGAIVGGKNFTRGDFPWNVALMDKRKTPPEFFCGGTLVSSSHVITGKIKMIVQLT